MNLFSKKNKKDRIRPYMIYLLPIVFVITLFVVPVTANAQWYNPFDWFGLKDLAISAGEKLGVSFLSGIGKLMQTVIALFAELGGNLLDKALDENFALAKYKQTIEIGWKISRDVANIFFIIALLGIAITTVFKISSYQAKSLLPWLIIMALLINFSLAIGFVIIDFTHILGKGFYNIVLESYGSYSAAIVQGTKGEAALQKEDIQGKTQAAYNEWNLCANNPGLFEAKYKRSCVIPAERDALLKKWEALRVELAVLPEETIEEAIDSAKILWANVLLLSIMVFVLFVAAVMMIIRFAVLALLLVLAPLAFLFFILPVTRSLWTKWWNTFLSHAFFLPAFLFLMYFVIRFTIEVAGQVRIKNDLTEPSILLAYTIAVIMLLAALILSKSMGVYGAGAVVGVAKSARKFVVGYTGGMAYRNLVARPAQYIAKKTEGAAGRSALAERTTKALQGIVATKVGGKSLVEKQQATASLKGLNTQQQGEKLQRLTIPQRDLAMQELSNKQIAELRYMSRNNASQVKAIDDTIKKITAGDVEKAEKIGEEIARTYSHLPVNQRYDEFKKADAKLQSSFVRTWNDNDIQKITNGLKQGGIEKEEFVKTLRKLSSNPENKVSDDKLNAALSVAPALAEKLSDGTRKDVEDRIRKVDFEKIDSKEFAAAIKEIVDRATPKQSGKIVERSDLNKEYVTQFQSRFNAAGKDIDKFADTFKATNSAMENQIRHNKVFRERMGIT